MEEGDAVEEEEVIVPVEAVPAVESAPDSTGQGLRTDNT